MKSKKSMTTPANYTGLVSGISELLEQARRTTVRAVNSVLTATYWEIGRRIVEFEQGGKETSEYGEKLLERISADLTARHGRGFSRTNVSQMRAFYAGWEIVQTPSEQFEARSKCPSLSGESSAAIVQTVSGHSKIWQALPAESWTGAFPLSWSHYVRLMSVEKPHARAFYETEAIRGGWSVRQLDRQIGTQFFERTAHSTRQAVILFAGAACQAGRLGHAGGSDSRSVSAGVSEPEGRVQRVGFGRSHHPAFGVVSAGTRRGLYVRGPAEAHPHRRRVVSDGPVAVPPAA